MKIEEVKEQQKEFEKNSTELLEKLKKISDKREKCEVAAKDLTLELEAVSCSDCLSPSSVEVKGGRH